MLKITLDEAVAWYRRMLLLRRFEEKCAELYNATKIRGFLHLYIGEEACATGLIPFLRPEDSIIATYREHAHALLRGVPARAVMAEMFGKATGCCKGRGGSMHIFDKRLRFFGGNAIVAGGLPLAVGIALADKMQKRKAVTVVFFGEGAMAEGEFHESMNLAKLWKLPVLFACENNFYAMGTALARSESETNLTSKAASYHMKVRSADGMDLAATTREALATINEVRESGNPQFLEFKTYRFRAHSMYDPDLYRSKEEIAEHQKSDPILIFEKHMREQGLNPDEIRPGVEASVKAEIDDAVKFAEESPFEEASDLLKDVTTPVPLNPYPLLPEGEGEFSKPSPPGRGSAFLRRGEGVKSITYREGITEGLRYAFQNDPRVFMMGEDIGKYGGPYGHTKGFLDEFGEDRIRDAPLSESAFTGAGIGAALNGMRPIVEIMTVNFSLLALDQIINTAAALRHMSGGQFSVPLVIRMTTGAGRQLAAQHSHSFEGWYAHIPGIRIVAPSNAGDARGMLWTALKDPDPVLIFEHALLFQETQEVDADFVAADLDRAAVAREGQDVTLICYGGMVPRTLKAAAGLADNGISAEVIDLRTLRPLDRATILASVSKTRRAVIVDEGWKSGSLSAEIAMSIVEGAFYELDAPIARVCSEEVPIPYAAHMEQAAIPQVEKIVAAVNKVVYGG